MGLIVKAKHRLVVLHIPHSSRCLPSEERRSIVLDGAELSSELLRMTDACTDELFPFTPVEAGRVVLPVSRLVCDVERFASTTGSVRTTSRFLHRNGCVPHAVGGPRCDRRSGEGGGHSVSVDAPFAGALAPLAFYRKDRRIRSVMMEINRRLYMDEDSGRKSPGFERLRDVAGRLVANAAEAVRALNAE